MRLLVSSPEDQASVNIRDELIALGGWEPCGTFSKEVRPWPEGT